MTTWISILVATSLMLAEPSTGAALVGEQDHLDRAWDLFAALDFAGAWTEFNALPESIPDDPKFQAAAAYCAFQVGEIAASTTIAERAIELTAMEPASWARAWASLTLGEVLMSEGKLDAAQRQLDQSIAASPELATPYAALGNLYLLRGKSVEAEMAYRESIERDPRYGAAIAGVSRCLWGEGRPREAAKLITDALTQNPDDPFLLKERGVALYEAKRFKEAVVDFKKALAFRPGDALVWMELGNALDVLGQFPEAEGAYGKAIALAPWQRELHWNFAVCLGNQERYEDALRELEYEEALGVVNPRVYEEKIFVLQQLGRPDEITVTERNLRELLHRR